MKTQWISALAIAICLSTSSWAYAEKIVYKTSLMVYRVHPDDDSKPAASSSNSQSTSRLPENSETNSDTADIKFGFTSLKLDGGELIWTGAPIEGNDALHLVSKPTFINFSGATSTISIKTERPVEYFKEGETLNEREFVRDTSLVETGLQITMTATQRGGEHVSLNIKSELSSLVGNSKISGTDIQGGVPIVSKSTSDTTLRVKLNEWVYQLQNNKVLILCKVERVDSEEAK